MLLIALIGMSLAAAGSLWRTESRRANETELLFIGDQYRQAIRSYYELDPAQPRLPKNINALLEDNRRPYMVRHLRRAYLDPLTGTPLELIPAPGNLGIQGVYSNAPGQPFKTAHFSPENQAFMAAGSYADWRFEFAPPDKPSPQNIPPSRPPEQKL